MKLKVTYNIAIKVTCGAVVLARGTGRTDSPTLRGVKPLQELLFSS